MKKKNLLFVPVLLCLISCLTVQTINAQKVEKLSQSRNGRLGDKTPDVTSWTTGAVNEQNSHYTECMTIPYQMELVNLVAGTTYCLTIGWDTKKGDKFAIDYLTSYDVDRNHDLFAHTAEPIFPLVGTALDGTSATELRVNIPTPSFPGATVQQQTDALAGFNEVEHKMTIWNGTILDMVYSSEEDLSNTTQETSSFLEICFTPNDLDGNAATTESVVLAWGGHIGSQDVWGEGFSATAINGSPYHMFAESCACTATSCTITGSLSGCGAKDVQLSTSAVEAPPECDIDGPSVLCTSNDGTTYTYTAISTDAETYQWEVINSGGTNAFIDGVSTNSSVEVNPGTVAGMFEVKLITTKEALGGVLMSMCSMPVEVILESDAGEDGTAMVCNDAIGGNITTVNLFASLGGNPDPNGTWMDVDGAGVTIGDGTNVDFTGVTPGDYDFKYTVTGTTPCPDAMATVTVSVELCLCF